MVELTVRRQVIDEEQDYPAAISEVIDQFLTNEKNQREVTASIKPLTADSVAFDDIQAHGLRLEPRGFGLFVVTAADESDLGIWKLEDQPDGTRMLVRSIEESEERKLVQEYLASQKQ